MKKSVFIFLFVSILSSCVSEKERAPKSPTIYGAEFCECLLKHEMDDKECTHIIQEIKEVHGEDNEEAEKEFKNAVKTCIRNKSMKKTED
jgi:hypothetical protein